MLLASASVYSPASFIYSPYDLTALRAFISGPGTYNNYGTITVTKGGDLNQPEESSLICYYTQSSNETPVFPLHWSCFEILARALTGSQDVSKIDKDALYSIMAELTSEFGSHLNLRYGNIHRIYQFWECVPGEEFSVTNPLHIPGFCEFLSTSIASINFDIPSASLDSEKDVVHDPFNKLPYDLLYTLFPYLGGDSTLALIKASWHVHCSTRDNAFWKQLIRWEILPWFWELREILAEERSSDFDYKGLYLWLDKMTTPEFGMEGPFMGIANRRRIWDVCQQLANIYFERERYEPISETDEYAEMILEHSMSLHMPMILYPQPKNSVSNVSKQWIRSFYEVDTRASTFETFWNAEGTLVGLAVAFGTDPRVFGRADTDAVGDEQISKQVTRIPATDWISGLILHIPEMNMLDKHAHTAVKGVTVVCRSGKNDMLGDTGSHNSQRPLIVSLDRYLVGVVGQIGGNGLISRLGLLECVRPPNDDFSLCNTNPVSARQTDRPELSIPRRLLWHCSGAFPPIPGLDNRSRGPIWSYSYIHMLPLPPPTFSSGAPADLIPHQLLLWVKNAREESQLKRISAYVVVGGMVTGFSEGKSFTRPIHDVLGFRSEYVRGYGELPRAVGGPPTKQDLRQEFREWDEKNMLHFEIDGPGGEVVTEVEIATAEEPKAIKIRTNCGREAYFGEMKRNEWNVQRAPEGEHIVGLAVTFATKSGFSHDTKEYVSSSFSIP
ncbi:hypothetical protein K432DRAFT_336121 [Lepidopterella palustris CBS 459.81]|uniref:F-box domain-containing protein n=1 Tax=Lepidopterella palustris CBS 459.81 TaxID=1314670 RepID=A0A8E2E2W8_9PEZI|nr:hypothetical protein K432DRAFT_336121 [Lepidopterella palustris CBS 459.81]